jgi:hypothetical protein
MREEASMAKKNVAATKSKAKKPGKAKESRSLNATSTKPSAGEPATNQDAKRRLGNFSTAGEHARQGGRTSGIVGQKKSQSHTDKRRAKKGPPI